jgi:hypothetical protein
MSQHVQGGSLVSQNGIGLSDLVNPLGIGHSQLFDPVFGLMKKLQAMRIVMLN